LEGGATIANAEKLVLTEAEYLAVERDSETKHEFVNGEAIAMAGATYTHNVIALNIGGELRSRLKGIPCRPVGSDQRVHVWETGLYTYPDISVVCGAVETHPDDPLSITNPRIIFEVLSESTEAYDRGAKFEHYQRVATLAEYVLVSQSERLVHHYARQEGGAWLFTSYSGADSVALPCLDVRLPLEEIYDGVFDSPVVG